MDRSLSHLILPPVYIVFAAITAYNIILSSFCQHKFPVIAAAVRRFLFSKNESGLPVVTLNLLRPSEDHFIPFNINDDLIFRPLTFSLLKLET